MMERDSLVSLFVNSGSWIYISVCYNSSGTFFMLNVIQKENKLKMSQGSNGSLHTQKKKGKKEKKEQV